MAKLAGIRCVNRSQPNRTVLFLFVIIFLLVLLDGWRHSGVKHVPVARAPFSPHCHCHSAENAVAKAPSFSPKAKLRGEQRFAASERPHAHRRTQTHTHTYRDSPRQLQRQCDHTLSPIAVHKHKLYVRIRSYSTCAITLTSLFRRLVFANTATLVQPFHRRNICAIHPYYLATLCQHCDAKFADVRSVLVWRLWKTMHGGPLIITFSIPKTFTKKMNVMFPLTSHRSTITQWASMSLAKMFAVYDTKYT